jgi:hypothetical protein
MSQENMLDKAWKTLIAAADVFESRPCTADDEFVHTSDMQHTKHSMLYAIWFCA